MSLEDKTRLLQMAGLLLVAVGLAAMAYGLWLRYRNELDRDDAHYRQAGHVPPETDPERTTWVPFVKADEVLDYGAHSRGVVAFRVSAYVGRHHVPEVFA